MKKRLVRTTLSSRVILLLTGASILLFVSVIDWQVRSAERREVLTSFEQADRIDVRYPTYTEDVDGDGSGELQTFSATIEDAPTLAEVTELARRIQIDSVWARIYRTINTSCVAKSWPSSYTVSIVVYRRGGQAGEWFDLYAPTCPCMAHTGVIVDSQRGWGRLRLAGPELVHTLCRLATESYPRIASPSPARNLCIDKNGWLWWERHGTISVASDLEAGELTPLDTFELDLPGARSNDVCLFVPRTEQSGVYALTESGRLLSVSVSDSRISAIELADLGTHFSKALITDACIGDDSSRTIVASNWKDVRLIDLLDLTISPLSVPVPETGGYKYIVALEHAGGTRFIAAFSDGTICLLDSQNVKSGLTSVKGPEPDRLTEDVHAASPNRALIAMAVEQSGLAVRNSGTLESSECWQTLGDDSLVSDMTWLDDRQLAVSLRTRRHWDRGELVIVRLGPTRRRRVTIDFQPWSILAITPSRLAIADRDGGVRVIQLDP